MVDLPKIPKRTDLTPQVASSVSAREIASVHSAWGSALESVASGIEDVAAPLAQEAGQNAVVRDEQGNLKVEPLAIVGKLGKIANRSAELAFSVQAEGEIERNLLELRNKTWRPVSEGGGGGDPQWYARASNEFIRAFAGQHRSGFGAIVRQLGDRTANGHMKALMNERERLDVKNQNDTLKAREELLTDRLATLAFDQGTDSEEFKSAVADLQAIRKQRSADPRFNYSAAEAEIDNVRTVGRLRGMAIVGQARRDYQATGDLAGAQSRAEKALADAGIPIDERGRMLGQINSHLGGMAAIRQQQKAELRDQAIEVQNRMQSGEAVSDGDLSRIINGLQSSGLYNDARRLTMQRAADVGRGLIQPGASAADRIKGLTTAGQYSGPVSSGTLGVARTYLGMSEADPGHANTLNEFIRRSAGASIDVRSTAWCAAYVDAVLGASGHQRRGSLRAADFLDYGSATDKPSQGDVVVFRSQARGSSGHVGIVVGIEGDRVRYIAGNDSNRVQEDTLPLSEVAGFRVPPKAGTPVQGVTDASAPGEMQRRAATVAFGASLAGSVALKSAREQFDALAKNELTAFDKAFSLPGGAPTPDQVQSLLDIAPHISDADLRSKILESLVKNEARLAVSADPALMRKTIAALQTQANEGGMSMPDRLVLKAMQDQQAAIDKELDSKPFAAGTKMRWDGDAAPRNMRAAAAPLDFRDASAIEAQVKSRDTSSQLLEIRTGRTAFSLIDKDDAEALRAAAPSLDAGGVSALFQSLAGARKETLGATLATKDARDALVSLTRTEDPAKFNAAMAGLDMLMRRDEAAFTDAMDADTLKRVAEWRDRTGYVSDPKQIAMLMNPPARGKEDDVRRAQRVKGEKIGREIDDGEIMREFRTFGGRLTFSNPDDFLQPGPEQATPMNLPQQAIKADLAMHIGDFMAGGMPEDAAKKNAFNLLKKQWGMSAVNGQVMKHAPDRYYAKFGFTPREMDGEIQNALADIVYGKPPGAAAPAIANQFTGDVQRIRYSLVPSATTQADIKAWQDWEKGGAQGAPPQPPRYQIMFENPKTKQFEVVSDANGVPRLWAWDVAKKRAAIPAQEDAFRAQREAFSATPMTELRKMREPR